MSPGCIVPRLAVITPPECCSVTPGADRSRHERHKRGQCIAERRARRRRRAVVVDLDVVGERFGRSDRSLLHRLVEHQVEAEETEVDRAVGVAAVGWFPRHR